MNLKFKLKNLIIVIFAILLSSVFMFSQAPDDKFISVELMENKDTLLIHRSYGDWWYGIRAGANGSVFFGDLFLERFPNEKNNPFNKILDYTGAGDGLGYFLGLTAEWVRPNKVFGYSFSLNLFDSRTIESQTKIIDDRLKTRYEFESIVNYLSISPAVKYYIGIGGLHFIWGFDLDIPINNETSQWTRFINDGGIEQKTITPLSNYNFRGGLNLGAGWDVFMADIRNRYTVRFTPFATVHLGTSMISDNNSSFNSVYARVGLSIKIGPDELKFDTLKFDSTYIPPRGDVASAQVSQPFGFPGFTPNNIAVIGDLALVYNPKIFSEATGTEEGFAEVEKPKGVTAAQFPKPSETEAKKIKILIGVPKVFTFARTDVTNLDLQMKNYLDEVAELMKTNPNLRVRIIGHSDNQGSKEDQLNRSMARTMSGLRYLLDKKVKREDIIDVGNSGALISGGGDNRTEEGRRKNRRLEVIVERK